MLKSVPGKFRQRKKTQVIVEGKRRLGKAKQAAGHLRVIRAIKGRAQQRGSLTESEKTRLHALLDKVRGLGFITALSARSRQAPAREARSRTLKIQSNVRALEQLHERSRERGRSNPSEEVRIAALKEELSSLGVTFAPKKKPLN